MLKSYFTQRDEGRQGYLLTIKFLLDRAKFTIFGALDSPPASLENTEGRERKAYKDLEDFLFSSRFRL